MVSSCIGFSGRVSPEPPLQFQLAKNTPHKSKVRTDVLMSTAQASLKKKELHRMESVYKSMCGTWKSSNFEFQLSM